jgi:hypothetical protein
MAPVKPKINRFNPDEIRATEISLGRLGRRDKFGWFGFGMDSILCFFLKNKTPFPFSEDIFVQRAKMLQKRYNEISPRQAAEYHVFRI